MHKLIAADAREVKLLTPIRHRWFILLVTLVSYVAAFLALYPFAGPMVASLSFFPVVVGAHLYGRWGGYLVVGLTSMTTGILFRSLEGAGSAGTDVMTAIVPTVALLITAEIVARLRSANGKLVDMIHSKDHFLASVSHELRTPLTGVVGFADILSETWEQLPDQEKLNLVKDIESQAKEVSGIIEDLLVASRAELDQLTVLREPVDVSREIEAVLNALPDLSRHNVLSTGKIGVMALADGARLRQIIRNLVTNAIRYGGSTIWVGTELVWGEAVIRVADSGKGLPDGEWETIFEPYHQAHIDNGNPTGVGIGLSVSRMLAGLMGGTVTYQHRNGMSVFEVTLPALISPEFDQSSVAMTITPATSEV